jgi:hypothetical protein
MNCPLLISRASTKSGSHVGWGREKKTIYRRRSRIRPSRLIAHPLEWGVSIFTYTVEAHDSTNEGNYSQTVV